VAAIAGDLASLDHERVVELLERIPDRPPPPPRPATPSFTRRIEVEEHDGDVVHLRLAYAIPGLDLTRARERAVAEVYSQLIGGPMASRLFDQLREQRGLCYWVSGSAWGYEDAAFLSIGCSVGAGDLDETYDCIETIVGDLRANGPGEEEVARARAYASTAVVLAFESAGELVDHAIQLIMEFGDHDLDPALHLAAVDAVTQRDVAELAAQVQPGPCVGCVGPVSADRFR
jgi:predicted Zn-dependent peptidase